MEMNDYQQEAQKTNLLAEADERVRLVAPMLGLASETGSLLDIYKKVITGSIDEESSIDVFREELGDLLWYVAAVAAARGLTLEDIAEANLRRTGRLWEEIKDPPRLTDLPVFDANFPPRERFPRRLVFAFEEVELADKLGARILLVDADPNAFPDGPVEVEPGKWIGFAIGEVGDRLKDNSRRVNGYRYHDALHISFMALLNWSATCRSVLRVKRKSDEDSDDAEDGARAIFSEEGLAAVLSRLARRRMGFRDRFNVDGETLDVTAACVEGLEVEEIPGWAWRLAIIQGFEAMRQLHEHRGGVLTANLDERTLVFSPP